MIPEMRNFERLADLFSEFSERNEGYESPYTDGEAYAFDLAAKWLREEIRIYEEESR